MSNIVTRRVTVSISFDALYDDIAESLQDDDALDMDFDSIHEAISQEFDGFFDFAVEVEYDPATKKIISIVPDGRVA